VQSQFEEQLTSALAHTAICMQIAFENRRVREDKAVSTEFFAAAFIVAK
jgi:hypothetical protein